MLVWVTRAQPAADRTAAAIAARGREALVAPLLELRDLFVDTADPRLAFGAALAFTSARGVAAFARLSADRARPVFAVGEATAAAARTAGFATVRSADGDGAALAALLADAAEARGGVLAPGAREPAFDLAAALAAASVAVRPLPLYAAQAVAAPPPDVLRALEGARLDAVTLHSPAAARALADLASPPADPRFAAALRRLAAFALSPACATPVRACFARPPAVAAAPREADLLALLAPA